MKVGPGAVKLFAVVHLNYAKASFADQIDCAKYICTTEYEADEKCGNDYFIVEFDGVQL